MPEIRLQGRQQEPKPLLAEIRAWLDQSLPVPPPSSAVAKALHYRYLHLAFKELPSVQSLEGFKALLPGNINFH